MQCYFSAPCRQNRLLIPVWLRLEQQASQAIDIINSCTPAMSITIVIDLQLECLG